MNRGGLEDEAFIAKEGLLNIVDALGGSMLEAKMTTKRSVKWLRPGKDPVILKKGAPVIWDKDKRQHYIKPDYFLDPEVKADAVKLGCSIHYDNVDSDVLYRMSDQPEDCRFCGMRTAFEEVSKSLQFHTCQHCGAGYYVTSR